MFEKSFIIFDMSKYFYSEAEEFKEQRRRRIGKEKGSPIEEFEL